MRCAPRSSNGPYHLGIVRPAGCKRTRSGSTSRLAGSNGTTASTGATQRLSLASRCLSTAFPGPATVSASAFPWPPAAFPLPFLDLRLSLHLPFLGLPLSFHRLSWTCYCLCICLSLAVHCLSLTCHCLSICLPTACRHRQTLRTVNKASRSRQGQAAGGSDFWERPSTAPAAGRPGTAPAAGDEMAQMELMRQNMQLAEELEAAQQLASSGGGGGGGGKPPRPGPPPPAAGAAGSAAAAAGGSPRARALRKSSPDRLPPRPGGAGR